MRPNSYEAYVYVDANYVRRRLIDAGAPAHFNPDHLWKYLNGNSADGQPIRPIRMFFYDAIDENSSEQDKKDFQAYLEKVEELPYIAVATGFVRPGKKKRREQKGVDVQIAVDALEAVWTRRGDAIFLVAGDADFCPLAEAVRRAGAFVLVAGFEASMSAELRHSADFPFIFPS